MASESILYRDKKYTLVCIAPDVCKTQVGNAIVPIPYPITHKLDLSKQCSNNVFINDNPTFLHEISYVDKVKGDRPGTKGGLKSNVTGKISHSKKHSSSVFINGKPMVRTSDQVFMNNKKS